jgi:hypothetical protein
MRLEVKLIGSVFLFFFVALIWAYHRQATVENRPPPTQNRCEGCIACHAEVKGMVTFDKGEHMLLNPHKYMVDK